MSVIIDSNIITISSKLISIALGIVCLFLLFEIKSRVTENLRLTFIYFIIADICLIGVRTLGIMDNLGIWVSTFYDSATVIFSLFLLLAILNFYRFATNVTKQIEKNISSEKAPEEKLQPQIVYATKLNEMENKIKNMENKIKERGIKPKEADKMSEGLKLQLSRLDKAFEEGYISKEAYEKGKERIKELNKILRKKDL